VSPAQEPDLYLIEHVRQALASDERVSELELEVSLAAGKVFVSGSVPTRERREAVTDVVRELLPDREVFNETTVLPISSTPEAETLS
jgi:hypothetical protein